jgi:hypothetical protein
VKHFVKSALCLAGGLAFNAGLLADDAVSPDNPYAAVVARNIFGLNPPTVETPATAEPPAKITPNGIMSIFGHLQVLFKVSGQATPGKPGDQSYILAEGQRQDDIEVVQIDQKAGIVTFNNHGIVQKLPLASATASNTPMPVFAPAPAQNFASPANIPMRNGFGRFGNRGGNFGGRNRDNGSGVDNFNNGMNAVPSEQQSEAVAESAAAILLQTEKYKEEGNPAYKIMPPPPGMTPPDDQQQ